MLAGAGETLAVGGLDPAQRAREQLPQSGALLRIERLQDVVLDRFLCALGQAQRLGAGGSELHEMAAAIAGVAQARDIAELLDLVEQQHDVVGVHAEGLGELVLGAGVVVAHVAERDEMAQLHSQQLVAAAPVDLLGQAGQQDHRARST